MFLRVLRFAFFECMLGRKKPFYHWYSDLPRSLCDDLFCDCQLPHHLKMYSRAHLRTLLRENPARTLAATYADT